VVITEGFARTRGVCATAGTQLSPLAAAAAHVRARKGAMERSEAPKRRADLVLVLAGTRPGGAEVIHSPPPPEQIGVFFLLFTVEARGDVLGEGEREGSGLR
jgi:hypothetical protein